MKAQVQTIELPVSINAKVLGGVPAFRGRACRSRPSLIIWLTVTRSTSSWIPFQPSTARTPCRFSKRQVSTLQGEWSSRENSDRREFAAGIEAAAGRTSRADGAGNGVDRNCERRSLEKGRGKFRGPAHRRQDAAPSPKFAGSAPGPDRVSIEPAAARRGAGGDVEEALPLAKPGSV